MPSLVGSEMCIRDRLYVTEKVWKIGSGDCFSAHFALNWILLKKSPEESALNASKATSYYCQTQCLPSKANLKLYEPAPLVLSLIHI